jgi:hypothetical protein
MSNCHLDVKKSSFIDMQFHIHRIQTSSCTVMHRMVHKVDTKKKQKNGNKTKKKTKEKKTSRQLKPSPHGAEKFTYIWA